MSRIILGIPVSVVFEGQGGDWSVEASDGARRLVFHPLGLVRAEPWEIRNEFLGIDNEDAALAFLQNYGLFAQPEPGIPVDGESTTDPMPQAGIFGLADIVEWSGILRKLLKTPPPKWGLVTTAEDPFGFTTDISDQTGFDIKYGGLLDTLPPMKASAIARSRQFHVRFHWEQRKEGKHNKLVTSHAAVIETHDILGALLATTYVDHLREAQFAFCARKDCRKLFEITSNHKRKYCDYNCAHLETVRRGRRKAKKKRRARKRTA